MMTLIIASQLLILVGYYVWSTRKRRVRNPYAGYANAANYVLTNYYPYTKPEQLRATYASEQFEKDLRNVRAWI